MGMQVYQPHGDSEHTEDCAEKTVDLSLVYGYLKLAVQVISLLGVFVIIIELPEQSPDQPAKTDGGEGRMFPQKSRMMMFAPNGRAANTTICPGLTLIELPPPHVSIRGGMN